MRARLGSIHCSLLALFVAAIQFAACSTARPPNPTPSHDPPWPYETMKEYETERAGIASLGRLREEIKLTKARGECWDAYGGRDARCRDLQNQYEALRAQDRAECADKACCDREERKTELESREMIYCLGIQTPECKQWHQEEMGLAMELTLHPCPPIPGALVPMRPEVKRDYDNEMHELHEDERIQQLEENMSPR